MSTLYARATPRQAKVLKIIEGAVLNTAHAHPAWQFHPRAARSIAKRAAGTLTAAWPSVLATAAPKSCASSDSAVRATDLRPAAQSGQVVTRSEKGGAHLRSAAHLRFLHNRIGSMAGDARRAGNIERHSAMADVLRMLRSMI